MHTVDELVAELKIKGIKNPAILTAIRQTPRHLFVAANLVEYAYADRPLAIASEQTISQPYIVARMTELLLSGSRVNKVLEIGTGSGYQAAVLAKLVKDVYSIERIHNLYLEAQQRLTELKLTNVAIRYSDGQDGWPEHAPYDGIMITAASSQIPPALAAQLKEGGRIVAPIGPPERQVLQVVTKQNGILNIDEYEPVMFVPLLSEICE